ncbi:MAG: class II glutamine amidotransferase [Sphingomonadaceae bacterium]
MGMNANTPTDVMFSFTGLATRADEHKDGFGIAFFEDPGLRLFVDHLSARASPVAELIKRYPIKSKNVIAHIRKATQGHVALENCHPFVRELWGRYWVFAHNGDLKAFAPVLDGAFRPVGSTDSELAFCYLLQQLRRRFGDQAPSRAQLHAALGELTQEIACHGTFNMLLSSGGELFAHCSTHLVYLVRQHPFDTAKLSDEDVSVDFSQVTTPNDRVAIIVTQPLTTNEHWTAFQPGELKLFVDGLPVLLDGI